MGLCLYTLQEFQIHQCKRAWGNDMVKTKVVKKLGGMAKLRRPGQQEEEPKLVKKKSMAEVHTETKPLKKGEFREQGDWWNDIMSGETCRTANFDKVVAALGRGRDQFKGLNIQYIPDHLQHFWYITRIMTEDDIKKPSEKVIDKKGKRK